MPKETLRSEWVWCGKNCGGCPHGPYWYAYWREGPRVRKRYVGKGRPGAGPEGRAEEAPPDRPPEAWEDRIFSDGTATVSLACSILGIAPSTPYEDAKRAYRARAAAAHPDRHPGESDAPAKRINAAWAYLRRVRDW